jgi:hypothetical protein
MLRPVEMTDQQVNNVDDARNEILQLNDLFIIGAKKNI